MRQLHAPVSASQRRLAATDAELFPAMTSYHWAWVLLQTIPGTDEIASARLRMEIADDMSRFGDAERPASCPALRPRNNRSAGKRKSART